MVKTERIPLVTRAKSPKYIGKWTNLLLLLFLPQRRGAEKAPSCLKSGGLGAFDEFGDAKTERIPLVTRAKSPKYIGKRTNLLLLLFLPQHFGAEKAPSCLEIRGTCCFCPQVVMICKKPGQGGVYSIMSRLVCRRKVYSIHI